MIRSLARLFTLCAAMTIVPASIAVAQHSAVDPTPRESEWWTARHESFVERARRGEVDIVFIGDSITQGWEGAGKQVWEKYYGRRKVMNLGISGDRTQHVLWRLDNGNLEGITPKAAVIMIGTNNHRDNSAKEIGEGIVAIVQKLRDRLPEMRILLLAIFPRGEKPNEWREKLAEASRIAARTVASTKVHYLDIGSGFLNSDGTISKEIMPDFLHLSPEGYEIWASAIEQKLAELLAQP